jgi:hypothetical protein
MRARAEQVSPVVLVNYQLVDGTYKGRLSFRKGEGEGEGCSQRVVPSGGLKPLTLVLSLGQGERRNKHHGTHNRRTLRIGLKSYSQLHGWCGIIRSIRPYEIP